MCKEGSRNTGDVMSCEKREEKIFDEEIGKQNLIKNFERNWSKNSKNNRSALALRFCWKIFGKVFRRFFRFFRPIFSFQFFDQILFSNFLCENFSLHFFHNLSHHQCFCIWLYPWSWGWVVCQSMIMYEGGRGGERYGGWAHKFSRAWRLTLIHHPSRIHLLMSSCTHVCLCRWYMNHTEPLGLTGHHIRKPLRGESFIMIPLGIHFHLSFFSLSPLALSDWSSWEKSGKFTMHPCIIYLWWRSPLGGEATPQRTWECGSLSLSLHWLLLIEAWHISHHYACVCIDCESIDERNKKATRMTLFLFIINQSSPMWKKFFLDLNEAQSHVASPFDNVMAESWWVLSFIQSAPSIDWVCVRWCPHPLSPLLSRKHTVIARHATKLLWPVTHTTQPHT